jgi:MscS family membrane protein
MPESLLKLGPWGLAYWQWLGIAIALAIAFIVGRLASRLVLWIGSRVATRTESTFDDEALKRLNRPVRFLGKVLAARALLPLLELPAGAEPAKNILLAGIGIGATWCAVALIDVVISRLALADWAKSRPASRALLSLAGRTLKVLFIIIATVSFLGSFGLPVGSLIAGLGIGGIALAFGAQKTVENLFGAFALGIDQPLREGDFVRLDNETLGTVESVGLRSTRVRTLDRTIVSLPNGRLADSRIETFGERDRVRLHTMLNLVHSTTAAQLLEVITNIERTLRDHPDTFKDEIIVSFRSLGASSLDIEIMAWYVGTDFGRFRFWRQDMLLAFVAIVETAGTSFAFPTQTLHIKSVPKAS